MIDNRFDVKDRVVLITGAGQGIGRAYAKAFAETGAISVIAELNGDNAKSVANEITDAGHRAYAIQTDVGDPASVQSAAKETIAKFSKVDVLINNAAIFTPLERRPFYEIPLEEWDEVMKVNVTGCFLAARAVAPSMIENRSGSIINISSSTVPMGLPLFMHYVTSKAAVAGMTRVMAKELGVHDIRVNAVMPGLTETEVANVGRTDELVSRIVNTQFIKRVETPEDLVGLLMFLASPASSFITGQSIIVDGGIAFS
ncbi:MAG: dehydrogenase [Rhodospirillaceae bacterium]|nr:dehydrogenase [Rhodospirillaceae bacterium]